MQDVVPELSAHVQRTQQAAQMLWSTRWQQFVSRDAISGELLDVPTSAGLLGSYAGFANDMGATVAQWLAETPYGLPSTRSTYPGFEPLRYWRGPVWQHINMLISMGLQDQGHNTVALAAAAAIRSRSETLFSVAGFHEYYDPLSGQGLGGRNFSWTAATYLHWILD